MNGIPRQVGSLVSSHKSTDTRVFLSAAWFNEAQHSRQRLRMAWASLLIFILDSRLMGNLIERLKVLMEDNNGGVPTAVRLCKVLMSWITKLTKLKMDVRPSM
ncbi:hypothetical protein ACHAP6_003832 [Verticillium nonalfalfae]